MIVLIFQTLCCSSVLESRASLNLTTDQRNIAFQPDTALCKMPIMTLNYFICPSQNRGTTFCDARTFGNVHEDFLFSLENQGCLQGRRWPWRCQHACRHKCGAATHRPPRKVDSTTTLKCLATLRTYSTLLAFLSLVY